MAGVSLDECVVWLQDEIADCDNPDHRKLLKKVLAVVRAAQRGTKAKNLH